MKRYDSQLIERGEARLRWAKERMPVLAEVRDRLKKSGALRGVKIGMALHTEAKTGVLALTLKEAGAEISLTSCNPLSTDDCVAAALGERHDMEVYAKKGQTGQEYYRSLNKVIDIGPDYVIDDGADLIFLLHTKRKEKLPNVKGGNEETTTGIIRLRAMAEEKALKFPVISVNDAMMKHLFDNRYGTGQSTFDGIMTSTNLLIAGRSFVVAGYGWCGRGVAMRARGMGARVTVTEVDPVRAVEARLDGFDVAPMIEAVKNADFIVTTTGCKDVLR
ncbi:MAG: adenosylhomocysteinase, partial [Thermoplasmata archaeon]|nr:adenosylhomocysteinase [Thermoplasmata archaeon]